MDIFEPKKRSEIMSRVKGKDTGIELIIFGLLDELKIKYTKHSHLRGKPDIEFTDKRVVVFIDGDFWHGYHFSAYKAKLSEYWYKKIKDNIKRDRKNRNRLKNEGWMVIRLWEHRIKKNPRGCLKSILKALDQ